MGDTIPRRDPSALYLLEAPKQLVSWGSAIAKSPSDQRQDVGFNWLSGREDRRQVYSEAKPTSSLSFSLCS